MLTPTQLRELRRSDVGAAGNRLAKAMELEGLKQADLAQLIQLAQPYISDVARGRHQTITVENAYRFAAYFGCSIEDLFPSKAAVA